MNVIRALAVCVFLRTAFATNFPPPTDLGPTNQYGRELRSLGLMSAPRAEKKRTIKILFYGQSVTQEPWSYSLKEDILQSFPNANLVVTNLAIGYLAEFLLKPARTDIPDFYPDLMIYQNYGGADAMEKIVALTRRQTTADIILQNEHVNYPEDMFETIDLAHPESMAARAYQNYVALPAIADRYGAEFADVRTPWKKYLNTYQLPVEKLLRDNIHPNAQGNYLMTELLKPYFSVRDSFPSNDWAAVEKNYVIGRDLDWQGDLLRLEFVGNRVDVIADANGTAPVEVLIDERKPSEFPELYSFSRTDWYPNSYWLSILEIGSQTPLVEEEWSAKILSFSTNNGVPFARFAVTGSKTGYDGEGVINERFVSRSGRVVIEADNWLMLYWAAAYYPTLKPLPVGHEIHWRSHFAGKDQFIPAAPDPTLESNITVAQGLANGPHVLTLKKSGPTPISAIRIFNPLARQQPAQTKRPIISNVTAASGQVLLESADTGRYVLESSVDCMQWRAVTAAITNPVFTLPAEQARSFYRIRSVD